MWLVMGAYTLSTITIHPKPDDLVRRLPAAIGHIVQRGREMVVGEVQPGAIGAVGAGGDLHGAEDEFLQEGLADALGLDDHTREVERRALVWLHQLVEVAPPQHRAGRAEVDTLADPPRPILDRRLEPIDRVGS